MLANRHNWEVDGEGESKAKQVWYNFTEYAQGGIYILLMH